MEMHSQTRRIVITGLGILCALGNSPESVYRRMLHAESGIKPVRRFETKSMHCSIAGELDADQLAHTLSDESTASLDACAQYAVQASRQALESSGLEVGSAFLGGPKDNPMAAHVVSADRIGLILGTCNGGILSLEKQWNLDHLDKHHTANYPFYQQGDDTARLLGLQGPVTTINTACSASGNTIGYAADLIRWGYADVMLAGGSDPLSQSVFAGFNVLRALNPEQVSPFSSQYGLNLGEGAAFVVLESLDHALARGAQIYGELCAYGLSNDAFHETAPHPEGSGLAKAIKMALKKGQLAPDQIEYINAHGTGTQANDKAEIAALRQVFGEKMRIPISSSKAYFGHNLGAAAAVELVTTLFAVRQGYLPGTLNFEQPRSGCEDVDIIGEKMRQYRPEYMLSNNAAFGGHNVSLLIRTGVGGTALEEAWKQNEKESNASVSLSKEIDDKNEQVSKVRVVITGIGAVGHWGISQGRILDVVKSSMETGNGETQGYAPFSLKNYEKSKYERRMNALTQYTIGAAMAAIQHAELDESMTTEIGFIYGTARGSTESISRFLQSVFVKGPEFASSIYFPHTVINSVAGKTAQKLKLQGFNSSISTGGNEGITAALYAKGMISNGNLSTCLIGAGDERSALSDSIDCAKGLTESRYVSAEGSVCMVLKNMDQAMTEGSHMIAELRGFGTTFTADLKTEAKENAICDAIIGALSESELSMENVDLVLLNSVGRKNEWKWEQDLLVRMAGSLHTIPPVLCLNDHFGYGESYSSMLHLAAAAELISQSQSMKMFTQQKGFASRQFDHVLVISSSVNGNYTTAVVSRI